MSEESLETAKQREMEARRHGRHIKLEQELNAIGLSLFAPPLHDTRLVQMNEWEGWWIPEHRTELQNLIDKLATDISDIDKVKSDPELLNAQWGRAMVSLTDLAKYISNKID